VRSPSAKKGPLRTASGWVITRFFRPQQARESDDGTTTSDDSNGDDSEQVEEVEEDRKSNANPGHRCPTHPSAQPQAQPRNTTLQYLFDDSDDDDSDDSDVEVVPRDQMTKTRNIKTSDDSDDSDSE